MDNGFPILDAFNDDQAFERHFGSLLDDASNQLPDLDTGVLDEAPGGGDGLEVLGEELFDRGSLVSGVSPGGPMLTQQTQPKHSPAGHQFTAPSPSPAPGPPPSPAPHLLPPAQSPANILYAKSPAAHIPPQSPRSSNPTPVMSPQPLQPLQAQPASNSIFLSTSSTAPQASLLPGTVLTQPIQLHPSGAGQMFQLQLQPTVSVMSSGTGSQSVPLTPNKAKQPPQLLPKPAVTVAKSLSVPASVPASSQTQPAAQQPLILGQAGIMMGQQQPLLIQQPQGNMMILRPSGPTVANTVLPMGGLGGQIIVQQTPAPQPGTIMPNVKLITPQGQMQMQKIQTPSGPKLIAVPLGQTLIQAPNIINTNGQIQLAAAPSAQTFTLQPATSGHPATATAIPVMQSLNNGLTTGLSTGLSTGLTTGLSTGLSTALPTALPTGLPTALQTGLPTALSTGLPTGLGLVTGGNVITNQQTVIQPQQDSASPSQSPVSPTKRKKPKKKKKEDEPPALKAPGAVDLGALMKDVGLDFGDDFGFGLEASTSQSLQLTDSPQNLNNSLNSSQNSSSSEIEAEPSLLESRQPQSLQLVQGPDGNYNFILQTSTSTTVQTADSIAPGITVSTPASAPTVEPSKPSPRPAARNRNIVDANRTPLYEDDTLPPGWHRKVSQRKSGASAGRYEVFIIGPNGKRFRSRNELKSFFEKTGETKLNPDDFDFSTFGRNNPKAAAPVVAPAPVSTVRPTVLTSLPSLQPVIPAPVTTTTPTAPSSALSESELIKNLENSAMASVAAARALEVGSQGLGVRHSLLQSIQQPIPQASLAVRPAAPPPPLVVPPPNIKTSSNLPPTPLSADMEDAESQISFLLESLQKQSSAKPSNSSDQEFFESLTSTSQAASNGGMTISSEPETSPVVKSETFPKPSRYPGSPSMPVLTPQVTLADPGKSPQDTSFQNKYLDNLARSQISDKRRSRHESGGMPLLSPTTGILHSPGDSSSSSDSPRHIPSLSKSVVVTAPPNVTVHTSVHSPATTTSMGGPVSQIRALQQLPPNTRLQHGPNGQIMIQKIQTIELSPPMQQQYKLLAQKISIIEQKAVKSPQDEADLAELQAKQHQILSTGRPVFAGQQQPSIQPNIVAPQLPKAPVMTPVPFSLPGLQSPPQAILRQPAPPQAPPPVQTAGNVPPLTDLQKKIVAEFKCKMANLPPEEQAAYIAQNKVNLIKQLNFQPNQLRILQTSQPQAPVLPTVRPPAIVTRPNLIQLNMTSVQQRLPAPVITGLDIQRPPLAQVQPFDKSKRIAWVESQLRKDQQEAVNPNYKTPFRSREDACKRLLRYHVYNEPLMDEAELAAADDEFERSAESLVARYEVNLSKYHLLLLDESTRLCSSSCEAMLGRMWVAEERSALAREKEEFRENCTRLAELDRMESLTFEERNEQARLAKLIERPDFPPVPDSWADKYQEIVGRPWELYKQKHKKRLSPTNTNSIQPQTQVVEEPVEIKKEPRDCDSEADVPLRERHESSNSDVWSQRSRNSSASSLRRHRRDSSDISKFVSFRPPSSSDNSSMDKSDSFVGLKFNRSMSGRWSAASLKREGSGGWRGEEYEIAQKRMKGSQEDKDFSDDSDDEDFNLADVGGNNAAVQSMLENDDDLDAEEDELRFGSQSRLSLDTFEPSLRYSGSYPSPGLGSDSRDNDSVQNAINSILDFDRVGVETPDDLRNLTGLLDAMESDTQNAVNSIL